MKKREIQYLYMLILFISFSFIQVNAQTLPNGLDGVLEYKNGNLVDFSKYKGFIIRSNNVSLKLDELIYHVEDNGEYYIGLEVNYYDWKDQNINRPEPTYSIAKIFKETIDNNKTTHRLKNKRLTSNLPLEDINNIEVIARIVKVNSKKEEKLNKIVDEQLNNALSSFPAISIVNQLIDSQKEEDVNTLVFSSDYDVPLNSFEFAKKEKELDSTRLIINNRPIYIPLETKVKSDRLKPSVLSILFKKVSQLSGAITGATFAQNEIPFNGIMKLHFTTDDNSNVPSQVTNGINDLVFSINSDPNWKANYTQAKANLEAILKTYRGGDKPNDRIVYGVRKFLDLSESYSLLYEKETQILANANELNSFFPRFKDFYKDLSLLETNYGFVSYGIENIYPGKYARIFIPYGLDDTTAKVFIKWQISIHEMLSKQTFDLPADGLTYKLSFDK
jgi:hypothetical protein